MDFSAQRKERSVDVKNVVRRLPLALAAIAVAVAASPRLAEAKIVKGSMLSPANGRAIEYRVYTPPGYNPKLATRYPVVYSLHGEGGVPSQRANNYAGTLDAKITSGEIMPMIWVFPDGQNNSYYGNSFDGSKQVYTHIINELVPKIDATFKTVANRDNRAVEGFSMGGFGAGLLAAKNSEQFSATLLEGAAVPNWSKLTIKEPDVSLGMYNNVEANWLPYSLWDQTRANAAKIASTVNYKMIVGDHDGQMANNLKFRDFLLSLGIDPQFQVAVNVGHGGSMYIKEGSGLAFLHQHFLSKRQETSAPILLAVPEPATWGLTAVAALALIRRRCVSS
jgi:S-formylglutathione hydrolase FrmB